MVRGPARTVWRFLPARRETMRKIAILTLVAGLAACELGDFEDWDEPLGAVLVTDHQDPLTDGEADRLFTVRYCPESSGPAVFVSDVRLELTEQGMSRFPEVRFELTVDANGDRRFGPGDEILAVEKRFNSLDQGDLGTYKVQLRDTSEFPEQLIGEADWTAR